MSLSNLSPPHFRCAMSKDDAGLVDPSNIALSRLLTVSVHGTELEKNTISALKASVNPR